MGVYVRWDDPSPRWKDPEFRGPIRIAAHSPLPKLPGRSPAFFPRQWLSCRIARCPVFRRASPPSLSCIQSAQKWYCRLLAPFSLTGSLLASDCAQALNMMATGLQKDATAGPAGALGSATSSSARRSEAPGSSEPSLQNRAGESSSPYVRAHAETPVAWQLLDDQAIARARRENKLIFLNIGYRACHCRFLCQLPFPNRVVAPLLTSSVHPSLAVKTAALPFRTLSPTGPSPTCSTRVSYPSSSIERNGQTLMQSI